jgi:regulator of protease activity HflC (stomatin/prohibitin superfamily)
LTFIEEKIMDTFFTVLFGVCLGLLFLATLLFVFGLASPLFIQRLVNNPKGEDVSPDKIHFFTFIEPGQVKIIVRGKRFIRAIMNDPERVFSKTGYPRNADYWWIVPAKQNEVSEPLPPFDRKNPFSWWSHWVYRQTGAVFVGIWPFQGVRVVENQRIHQQKENGKILLDDKGLPILEDIEDWSDHLRVKGFIWYFKVPTVDTKDFLKIGFQGNVLARCVNPYLTTYNQEHWDSAVSLKISTLVTAFCKTKTYAELSTSTDEQKYLLADFLKSSLNEFLSPHEAGAEEKRGIGMEILEVNITDQDPQLDEKDRSALTEPWRAEQAKKAAITASEGAKQKRINESEGEKKAIINISEGEAQAIVNRIVAIKSDGEIGEMLIRYDAWKNAAQAGGATFFFGDNRGGSKELDPVVFAKLEEIRKQLASNADKNKRSGS